MRFPILLLLSIGHLVVDLNQGGLPFFLPFFKEAFSLSYTAAGTITLASNLSSSIIQPLFGLLSDRRNLRWLLPAGCLLGGVGIGLSGLSPSYGFLLLLAVLSGLGVAAYHPEASKVAHWASGPNRATSMAVFSVGGNLGFGLGPLFAGYLYARAGLAGSVGFILPAAVMFLVLWLVTSKAKPAGTEEHRKTRPAVGSDKDASPAAAARPDLPPAPPPYGYVPVVLLLGIVILRSWVHAGLTTYIPFYYVTYLGGDPAHASRLQTVFLVSGAVGTLVGSPLADRWGLKNLILLSMAAQVPLVYLFPHAQGFWLYAILAASGFLIISTFATTVVLGQELLPRSIGLASGLMMGFGIGTGGLGVILMGAVADTWGVPVALSLLSILPALAMSLAFWLPQLPKSGKEAPSGFSGRLAPP